MAITQETFEPITWNGTSATSHTQSMDAGSGSDRIVLIAVHTIDNSATVTSISVGGISLAKSASANSGSLSREVSIWYGIGIPSGTQDIVTTYSASTRARIGGVVFTGVEQSTPQDDSVGVTNTVNVTATTLNMTASVPDCVAVGFCIINSSSAAGDSPDANSLEITENDIAILIKNKNALTIGATSIGVTHVASQSGGVAVLIKPVSGGGTPTVRRGSMFRHLT